MTLEYRQVGILDVDICGPSVPLLLGVENKEILQCSEGWVPVFADDEQVLLAFTSFVLTIEMPAALSHEHRIPLEGPR